MTDRETVSSEPVIASDEEERAKLEAENALLQFDLVLDMIDQHVRDGRPFRLRGSTILALHRQAMVGIHPQAGTWRNAPVTIAGSAHQPPAESMVVLKVEEMCDWVEDNWSRKSAIELCSYIMWRLNWIHPFADGNGRTTRALAYLILCVKAGNRLPGAPTIPEQIASDKAPYYQALEQADQSDETSPDLGAMNNLLADYLERQLQAVLDAATGVDDADEDDRRFH